MASSEHTQAGEGISAEQFLQCLADSGLLAAEEIDAVLDGLPADQRGDAGQLAQEFLRQQKLTPFQARMLLQGKVKGLVLGNYVILDKLGQGGMGMVLKARHRRMERVVALKVLSPAIVKNPSALQRFQREVKAAAKLSHPNIVAAHDADETKGVHFLVMEYVEGSDLSALVKKQGPLSADLAVSCVLQAAHGLLHAHEAGIVHRDIKPANLLLDGRGVVKVLDMGLARIEGGENDPTAVPDELTQSGAIMGSWDYMAPEQAVNTKKADRRADVYSLGCTLYYLLTGKPMFGGETAMEKMLAHREQPIPPLPNASKKLQAVYTRMVAKTPEERYPSMAEVIAELEPCATGGGPTGITAGLPRAAAIQAAAVKVGEETISADDADEPAVGLRATRPRKSSKWGLLIGFGAAAAVLLALGVWLALQRSQDGNPSQAATGRQVSTTREAVPPVVDKDADWLKAVAAMPPEKQVEAIVAKLKERNPRFDGKVAHNVERGVVTHLHFLADDVTDIAPVRALTGLKSLACHGSEGNLGKLADLSPLKDMKLEKLNVRSTQVADLSPLKNMMLTKLECYMTPVNDLSPLQGMPLKILRCHLSKVADLTPLKGMPLEHLYCDFRAERDAAILRPIKTLETINGIPAADFWKDVDAKQQAPLDAWMKTVAAMPPEKQIDAVAAKLKERNPGFDGQIQQKRIEKGVGFEVTLLTDLVTDISPLRALPGMQILLCTTSAGQGKLADLTPLKHTKVTYLLCGGNPAVSDLSPLKDLKLTGLGCNGTQVSDLSPLKGMPLMSLFCAQTQVADLSPLKDMPLTLLRINETPVADLAPLKGMKLTDLDCRKTKVLDFTPLRDMPLKSLACDFRPERDTELLRSIKTLEKINGKPAAEFWKDVNAQQAAFDAWLKDVAAMPAEKQIEAVAARLKERNPGFNGIVEHQIMGGTVTDLKLLTDKVTDLTPVRALTGLRKLACYGSGSGKGQLADLTPLKDLKLIHLGCQFTAVSDLSPLKDMPLTVLSFYDTRVIDLAPLKGMPLKEVWCDVKPERDAAILRSIKTLETINGKPAAEVWKEIDAKKP